MASIIKEIIREQNYELVRDRVAYILKQELDNQAKTQSDTNLTGEVFIERFSPPSEGEGNVICINLDQCNYDNQTAFSQSNEIRINIDVYCDSTHINNIYGYENSGKKSARLSGLIRGILQRPEFDRLLFANGTVERRSIQSIRFARVSDEQDAHYVRMARVELLVRVNETVGSPEIDITLGYDTQFKISDTEKGYKLTINNY